MRRAYVSGGETEIIDEIYEVYYNDDGKVDGWTENPTGPSHYVDVDEGSILDDVKRFERACTMPILDYKTGKEIE